MRTYPIPGESPIEIEQVVLDLNGTLSNRGELIDGVPGRLARLSEGLALHVMTADTRGVADRLMADLPVSIARISRGPEKAELVRKLGADRTVAIGNGRNDEAMLRVAAIGIVVIGPEGATAGAVRVADVVCASILDALDLLLDSQALASTLRP